MWVGNQHQYFSVILFQFGLQMLRILICKSCEGMQEYVHLKSHCVILNLKVFTVLKWEKHIVSSYNLSIKVLYQRRHMAPRPLLSHSFHPSHLHSPFHHFHFHQIHHLARSHFEPRCQSYHTAHAWTHPDMVEREEVVTSFCPHQCAENVDNSNSDYSFTPVSDIICLLSSEKSMGESLQKTVRLRSGGRCHHFFRKTIPVWLSGHLLQTLHLFLLEIEIGGIES